MKILKYGFIAFGVLVAIVVALVAFVAATFDPDKYKPEITEAVKARTGRTLSIEGSLGLSFFPKIGVNIGKTTLSEPRSANIFVSVGEAKVSLALLPLLDREVVVDRVSISGLSVELVRHKDGSTNFGDLAGGKDKPHGKAETAGAGAVKLEVEGVSVKDSTVTWRDEADGGQFKLAIAEFATGRIAANVPGKLALKARLEAGGPKAAVDLQMTSGYRLDLEKSLIALSGLDIRLSADIAAEEGRPARKIAFSVAGDADADLGRKAANASLSAKFDDSTVQAKLGVASFDAPVISFDVAVDKLDIDRYLPPRPQGAKPAGPEKPIDLSGLKALNAKGSLRIGQLTAANLKVSSLQAGLRAAGGRIQVNPLSAKLYEGSASGSALVNAKGNQVALKQAVSGVAIGPLLRDLTHKDMIDGKGNVALDVHSSGATVSAMKKALSGTASVKLADGAIKGINLAETFRQAKAALGAKSSQEQSGSKGDKTDFTELSASFVIRNGVAHNEGLSAKSPFLRLSGAGDIDIGAGSLNYLAKATVVATSGGQGAKDLGELAGVTIPVRASGPFDALKYRIEFGSVGSDVAKQKLDAQSEEKKQQIQEQIQDRLKGLFRR